MSSSLFSTLKEKGDLYLASSLYDGLEDNDLNQVITLLKEKKANPNVLMPLHGITPFHLVIGNDSEAFAEEVTKLFLQHGGNPNVKSVDDMTPVHVAAAWGRIKILELLLLNGGDPLSLDLDSCTPFHYAFQGEHYEAVSILNKYCSSENDEDEQPKYKLELDKVLINTGNVIAEYGMTNEQSLNSSYKCYSISRNSSEHSKISTNEYVPKGNSPDVTSNNNFITLRRNQRKITAEDSKGINTSCINKRNCDSMRRTAQDDKQLPNKVTSPIINEVDTNTIKLERKSDKGKYSDGHRANLEKKKQITMTFNRPKRRSENTKVCKSQHSNKKNPAPKVAKQQTPHSHTKKSFAISNKDLSSKGQAKALITKMSPYKAKVQKNILDMLIDEPILSKSPNLAIETYPYEKQDKSRRSPIFERKSASTAQPKFNKRPSAIRSSKIGSRSKARRKGGIGRQKKFPLSSCSSKESKKSPGAFYKSINPKGCKYDPTSKSNRVGRDHRKLMANASLASSTSPSESNDANAPKIEGKAEVSRSISRNLNAWAFSELRAPRDSHSTGRGAGGADTPSGSELVSGVGILDSREPARPESGLDWQEEEGEEEAAGPKSHVDLNQAILDGPSLCRSTTAGESRETTKSENLDRSAESVGSLRCVRGSPSSGTSDSFLSLLKWDEARSGANEAEGNCRPNKSLLSFRDDCSSCKRLDLDGCFGMEEEYKYEDQEEGVVLLERRLCVSPTDTSEASTSFYSCGTAKSEPLPKEMYHLDNATLRERLRNLGENPGPITSTTHYLYLKRLRKLESRSPSSPPRKKGPPEGSSNGEALTSSQLSIEWIRSLEEFEAIERRVFQEFANPNPSRKWREGNVKNSFNYLLLDPRVTRDLPRRAGRLGLPERWEVFLSAIFYVGKGKQSRPYAHLYDAFKLWVRREPRPRPTSPKIQRILDIWNSGKGVIVLHVFHNVIPVEAYTREAAMIQMLGTQKLGNCKYGDYYGVVATWRTREKCELGRYLLFKALQILLVEGERQIFPDNL